MPLILTEPIFDEGDDESEAATQAALAVAGMEDKDSHVSADLSDEDDESSDSDEDAGPPSMPGVPIERNTALGLGGDLSSFLDMFESEEEEKARLEKESQECIQREKREEEARQAEKERLRREEEEKRRKKKNASSSSGKKTPSPVGSPKPSRKSARARTGSASSGYSGSGSDSDRSPVASPNRASARKRRPPSVSFSEDNGADSVPSSPVVSPGKVGARSRADSDASSTSANSDANASLSHPSSPMGRVDSANKNSRPSSKKGISKRKSAAAELAKIDAAAPHITEKMRLGATLPHSLYKGISTRKESRFIIPTWVRPVACH